MSESPATSGTAGAGKPKRKMPLGRRFVKGQSGNPAGQRKIPECVIAAAKAYTPLAIETLAECCDRKTDPRVRVMAAEALLNRAWGKPVERTELTGKDGKRLVAAIEWRVVGPNGDSNA